MKSIIRFVVNTLVIIFALIAAVSVYFWYQKKEGKIPYLWKYTFYVTTGESMYPTIKEGELLIVEKTNDYKKNDIITFINDRGQTVTHRIIEVNEDKTYTTQGDGNKFIDTEHITKDHVVGEVIYNFTNYSKVLNFILTYKYYILGGFVFLAILGKMLL